MDDPDIVALIAAIEQFGKGQDLTGLERGVTDFAEAARDKIGLARQAIAQRIHPEFEQDQLEAATLRNKALRRALDILTARERLWWLDQSGTPLALKVSSEQGPSTATGGDSPPIVPPSDGDTGGASSPDPGASFPGDSSFMAETTIVSGRGLLLPGDEVPPDVPEPGPGPIFVATAAGFELDPRLPEETERNDAVQKALHISITRRIERLRDAIARISNTHPILAAEFADYAVFVGPDLAELDVASLWSAGSAISEFVRAFETQNLASTITPPLEPETLAEFRALLRDHTAFILGFDTGRKLTARAAAFRAVERPPEQIGNTILAVLRPMLNTPRLLAGRAQHLVSSLTRAFKDLDAKTFAVLVAGDETGKNGLIGLGRALHPVVLSAAGIDLALTLAGVKHADTLRAAAFFLHDNCDAVTAFIASDPQLTEWLLWLIERTRRLVTPLSTKNNLDVPRTQESPAVVGRPGVQARERRVRFNYSEDDGYITLGEGDAAFTLQFSKGSDKQIHFIRARDNTEIARVRGVPTGQVFRLDEFPHTSTNYTLTPGDRFMVKNEHGYVMQGFLLGIKDDTRGSDIDEVFFEYQINLERSSELRAL